MITRLAEKTYMEHSAEEIINNIYSVLKTNSENPQNINWENWYIGLTVYPNNEKKQIGKPKKWFYWQAKSPSEAKKAENYFINKYQIKKAKDSSPYDYFVFIYKF